eukprot:338114-Chlamydomonas_euryale.AAC.1
MEQLGHFMLCMLHDAFFVHLKLAFGLMYKIVSVRPAAGAQVFTEHTHIVAVRPTGNVYCWEAVEELNVKPKNWRDLLTEE